MPNRKPVFLVGPTAVGKSEIALGVAERVGAEIVSADSMQVYRGMDIGTAKPSRQEQARVPHHLIDVADMSHPFNAAIYRRLALAAIQAIQQRHRVPLVVGGSGMYLRALTEGLFEGPGADAALRAQLEAETAEALYARLQRVDPATAARIDRHNKRRLVRAIEVFEATGRPISALRNEWSASHRPRMIFLHRERADLYGRIERRVDAMFEVGLIEEVRGLMTQNLARNPVARAAAGYREVIAFLENRVSREEAIERTKIRTRQLAKRQLTWFRHQATLDVVDALESADAMKEQVVRRIENVRR